MGDMADYHIDQIIDQQAEVDLSIHNMSDKERVESAEFVLSDSRYQNNNYTKMIKSICNNYRQFGRLSEKQSTALYNHLLYTANIWYWGS